MNFRSFSDMSATIRRSLPLLPRRIDVVVGVPRSGLVPALQIALHLNVMATDVEGLLEGRAFAPGTRRSKPRLVRDPAAWRNVLIVDDSIDSGDTFRELSQRLDCDAHGWTITWCAIYGTAAGYPGIDHVLDLCPRPRVFEWNLVHQPVHMGRACLDIDGLLYPEPGNDSDIDAAPHLVPTVPVATLVTARSERYRNEIEDRLARDGVAFGELCMLELPGSHFRDPRVGDAFKAEVYSARPGTTLFVESEEVSAQLIARLSGKPVICTDTMTLF